MISNIDKENLALFANSCPAVIGPCVYKARSLYAYFQPGMQYDDNLLCTAVLPPSKNGGKPYLEEDNLIYQNSNLNFGHLTDFDIYPNPNIAGGQLTVSYNLTTSQSAHLTIYDMIGQIIVSTSLNPALNKRKIDLDNTLANGVYKVVLTGSNNVISTRKLIIVN